MGIFEDIIVTWKGKDYIVKSDRVMGLIDTIEDHVTLEELNSKNLKRAKITSAYVAVISYAGGKADWGEVYNMFFSESSVYEVVNVVQLLLAIMIPPEHLQSGDATEEKKNEPA